MQFEGFDAVIRDTLSSDNDNHRVAFTDADIVSPLRHFFVTFDYMPRGLWFRITSLRELRRIKKLQHIENTMYRFWLVIRPKYFYIDDLLLLLSSSPLPLFSIRLHDNEFRVIRFWFADNTRVCYF